VILDTNALSALADGDARIESILLRAQQLAIPVIVLGEYRYGIAQSRYRSRYENWLLGLTANCLVLPVNELTAIEYARIRGELKSDGCPIPANDMWIAALARQHRMPVISRDEHFGMVPHLQWIAW
jgi:tRNA(fMet)-specific endonuclease VapC